MDWSASTKKPRTKDPGTKETTAVDWSELPAWLVGLVATCGRLSLGDVCRMRATCRAWKAALPLPEMGGPWLVLSPAAAGVSDRRISFWAISPDSGVLVEIPAWSPPTFTSCWGSCDGALALRTHGDGSLPLRTHGHALFLYHPLRRCRWNLHQLPSGKTPQRLFVSVVDHWGTMNCAAFSPESRLYIADGDIGEDAEGVGGEGWMEQPKFSGGVRSIEFGNQFNIHVANNENKIEIDVFQNDVATAGVDLEGMEPWPDNGHHLFLLQEEVFMCVIGQCKDNHQTVVRLFAVVQGQAMKSRFRDWSSLPAALVEDISDRLSADADMIHIHQVCSHWRTSTAPLAALRPWVVAGHPYDGPVPWGVVRPVGRYSLWLPRGRDPVYTRRAPHALSHCFGTPRGWLAVTDDVPRSPTTRFILWEPISGSEIPIPYLRDVVQVFLSADPLDSPPAGWMALASHTSRGTPVVRRVSYWRPGDGAWTDLTGHTMRAVISAAFHRGRFYFTTVDGAFFGYDLNLGTASPPKRVVFFNIRGMFSSSACDCCQFHPVRAVHVATCGDDLLLVAIGGRRGRHTRDAVRVYRPAVREEDGSNRTVVEPGQTVCDLGEHSLFLGRGDSLALSANEFPGIKRNRVYYVEHGLKSTCESL
ncbi:hypothetical protein BAE44_0009260 [Dichanthelium oligosanthes]|uniref:KIB1-4 beta-propeller domain-containing protein n=1 Tax=Dichanthelium oligosanthes TaxID=888268 RepID=A0A1E5VX93_9POAL|nr:hypothetical protein BAE44_0009260 [Dichanthelium oligosanthes]